MQKRGTYHKRVVNKKDQQQKAGIATKVVVTRHDTKRDARRNNRRHTQTKKIFAVA